LIFPTNLSSARSIRSHGKITPSCYSCPLCSRALRDSNA
jgi:hypothetical protein